MNRRIRNRTYGGVEAESGRLDSAIRLHQQNHDLLSPIGMPHTPEFLVYQKVLSLSKISFFIQVVN